MSLHPEDTWKEVDSVTFHNIGDKAQKSLTDQHSHVLQVNKDVEVN